VRLTAKPKLQIDRERPSPSEMLVEQSEIARRDCENESEACAKRVLMEAF
jgi:hypothetical protein